MSMNIQRFHAATAREALALARAAFGDDTLILSNRQLDNGVEVLAAAESDLSSLDGEAAAAPQAAKPSAPPAMPANARPAEAPAALPMASTEEQVRADTEQLSMSTLSFQDYVRERMLRRQHEERQAVSPAPRSPATAAAALPAARSFAEARSTAPVQPRPATTAGLQAHSARAAEAVSSPPVQVTPPGWSAGLAEPAAPSPSGAATDMQQVLMGELHTMKELMEERFNTLAWLNQAKRDPIQSNLMLKLVRAGYSPSLSRAVLEPLSAGSDPAAAVAAVIETLERMLAIDPGAPSLCDEGGVFALIGATGVGKTTSAAKLAAQCARRHGAASVGLVTLDTQRAGAHEQLRAFGRSLGIVAHLAHDRAALQEFLGLFASKKMVLVDTAGFAPRDPRRRDLLDLLEMPNLKRVLVLNAGAHGDTLDEMAASFKIGGTRSVVLSKIDEAAKLGPALDTVIRHQFVLRGLANGQRVPQDWKEANAAELVRDSMRAAQRSHFDPRSADLDFFYAPAACVA